MSKQFFTAISILGDERLIVQELFSSGSLSDYLGRSGAELHNEVESLDSEYLLNVSEEELCQHLVDKFSVEGPILRESEIYVVDQKEVKIDVSHIRAHDVRDRSRPFYFPGTSITIAVPFDGEAVLFRFRPSTFTWSPPQGQVIGEEVHLKYDEIEPNAEELKRTYTRDIKEIREYLSWVQRDVDNFNSSLESLVKKLVTQRKEKLLKNQGIVSSLGLPIKKRNGMTKTYAPPEIRRRHRIAAPKIQTEKSAREPALPEEEYENILYTLKNMAIVMERSPKSFADMKEEDLRQHFLVQLNTQYEGQATGETFNFEGKTDILLRYKGKNVFIAECKFWQGPKELLRSINQLLSYTSWRDTKTAILIFNRNKDFTRVLEKIPEIVQSYSCFKQNLGKKEETIFRYLLNQPGDKDRNLVLTIMAFDMPK